MCGRAKKQIIREILKDNQFQLSFVDVAAPGDSSEGVGLLPGSQIMNKIYFAKQ